MLITVITYFTQNKVASSFEGNFYGIPGQGSSFKKNTIYGTYSLILVQFGGISVLLAKDLRT